MTQMSFSDAEYAGKRKQTRCERFLAEMEQVVPWAARGKTGLLSESAGSTALRTH